LYFDVAVSLVPKSFNFRAIGRPENMGVPVVMWWALSGLLVKIALHN
jgi:hypothetical protein